MKMVLFCHKAIIIMYAQVIERVYEVSRHGIIDKVMLIENFYLVVVPFMWTVNDRWLWMRCPMMSLPEIGRLSFKSLLNMLSCQYVGSIYSQINSVPPWQKTMWIQQGHCSYVWVIIIDSSEIRAIYLSASDLYQDWHLCNTIWMRHFRFYSQTKDLLFGIPFICFAIQSFHFSRFSYLVASIQHCTQHFPNWARCRD